MGLVFRPQYTLWELMGLVAVAAVLAAISRLSSDGKAVAFLMTLAFLPFLIHRAFHPPRRLDKCPYCGRRFLASLGLDQGYACEDCGTRCHRQTQASWQVLKTPGDDRPWVGRFLPALRQLRSEMRPKAAPGEGETPTTPG